MFSLSEVWMRDSQAKKTKWVKFVHAEPRESDLEHVLGEIYGLRWTGQLEENFCSVYDGWLPPHILIGKAVSQMKGWIK